MLDLTPAQLALVQRLLAAHVPGATVKAFGSRVSGHAKPYSDLDLAICGSAVLSLAVMSRLQEDFQESDLPFRVDLVDWHQITPEFRAIIDGHALLVPSV